MAKNIFSVILRERVMFRASRCCKYCKSQDKYSPTIFTIDHILPLNMGGNNDFMNLAYACFLCNRLKSNKLRLFDTSSEAWVSIFNPRIHVWKEHFSWNEDATQIIGETAIGRVTITMLKLNREKLVEYRNCLIPFGAHPPTD